MVKIEHFTLSGVRGVLKLPNLMPFGRSMPDHELSISSNGSIISIVIINFCTYWHCTLDTSPHCCVLYGTICSGSGKHVFFIHSVNGDNYFFAWQVLVGKLFGLGIRFSKSCNNLLNLVSDHLFFAFNVRRSNTVCNTMHSLSHHLDSSYRSSFDTFSIVSGLSKPLFLFYVKSPCSMLRNNSSTSMPSPP
jgi:hypothetical protein